MIKCKRSVANFCIVACCVRTMHGAAIVASCCILCDRAIRAGQHSHGWNWRAFDLRFLLNAHERKSSFASAPLIFFQISLFFIRVSRFPCNFSSVCEMRYRGSQKVCDCIISLEDARYSDWPFSMFITSRISREKERKRDNSTTILTRIEFESSSHLFFFVSLKSKILSSFEWQLFMFWIVFFLSFVFFFYFPFDVRAFCCRSTKRWDAVCWPHIMAIMCGKYMGSWSWRSKSHDEVRERALFRWWWW